MGAETTSIPLMIPTPSLHARPLGADGDQPRATPGLFEAREYVGCDRNGRPKQVSRTVKGTLKDADKGRSG